MPCKNKKDAKEIELFYGLARADVAKYFNSIKAAFGDDDEELTKFGKSLKDYKAQKIEAHDFIKGAISLFEGHPNLLLGLNAFLPRDKKVAIEYSPHPLEQECLDFVTKMKDISPALQKSFLEIMKEYGDGEMACSELIERVTSLLCDHDNLLLEFKEFIPSEVRDMWPDLAKDVDELFVYPHPSYSILTKKEKGERHASFMDELGKEVLNDSLYCPRWFQDVRPKILKKRGTRNKAWKIDYSSLDKLDVLEREDMRFELCYYGRMV